MIFGDQSLHGGIFIDIIDRDRFVFYKEQIAKEEEKKRRLMQSIFFSGCRSFSHFGPKFHMIVVMITFSLNGSKRQNNGLELY